MLAVRDLVEVRLDPTVAARVAGLRYVNPDDAGIERRRRGKGWTYVRADGKPVRDRATLDRIRSLAIPPAWTDVWISGDADGHIQATGRDARRRKQYRYHARWRNVRDEAKFDHMIEFAQGLPALRRQVDADLRRQGMPREKVLAAVVALLDATQIRVGNEEYARDNNSFGLTTLRTRHVNISGSTIELVFRGKSGVKRRRSFSDRRLARVVAHCQDLPGQRLFCYVAEDGEVKAVESGDVNEYLRAASDRDITSKDFRTWAATVATALALQIEGPVEGKTRLKKCVVRAVEQTAAILGNTPAVCRRSYIHPVVIDSYLEGQLCDRLAACRKLVRGRRTRGLAPEERVVLQFLRRARRRGAR